MNMSKARGIRDDGISHKGCFGHRVIFYTRLPAPLKHFSHHNPLALDVASA
jgi:hypothetical protein